MIRAGTLSVILLASAASLTAQGSLAVEARAGLVSIQADRVALGDLLRELDAAAGTTSVVPAGLEYKPVSVWFSDLPVRQAVRKVFEGTALDYAVIQGSRVVVLDTSPGVDAPAANALGAPPAGFQRPSGNENGQNRQGRAALAGRAGDILQQFLQGGNAPSGAEVQDLIRGIQESGGAGQILEQLRRRTGR
jgi:hypothetical protein